MRGAEKILVRSLLKALFFGLIGVFLAFIGSEIVFRYWASHGKIHSEPQFLITGTHFYVLTYDPELGWKNTPGIFEGRLKTGERFSISINSHGFRGPEIKEKKASGTFRILVVGDSVAWGWGVDQADIFSVKLEAALNAQKGRSIKVEVINAAVTGYGTAQELLLLRRSASLLKPDLVLVLWYENDIENNATYFEYGANRPVLMPTDDDWKIMNVPCPIQLLKPLNAPLQLRPRPLFLHSVLYRILLTRSLGNASAAQSLSAFGLWTIEPVMPLSINLNKEQAAADLLKGCRKESEKSGAKFIAVLGTHHSALFGMDAESPFGNFKKFLGSDFPAIDLFDDFRKQVSGRDDLVVKDSPEHLSAKGQEVLTEILVGEFQKRNLVR